MENDLATNRPNDGGRSANSMLRSEPAAPMVLQLGAGDESTGGGFSFTMLWRSLLQRLKIAAPIGVVTALLAMGALYQFSEKKYRSHAHLKISESENVVVFKLNDGSRDFAQTQLEHIKSTYIISQALTRDELTTRVPELQEIRGKEDAVSWIGQRLKAQRIGKSELYEVSFTTKNSTSAQLIVESIVKAYMDERGAENDKDRKGLLENLVKEIDRYNQEIQDKRANVKNLTKAAGGTETATVPVGNQPGIIAASGRASQMASLHQKLVDTDVEIEFIKAKLNALASELEDMGTPASPDKVGGTADSVYIPESEISVRLDKNPSIISLMNDLKKAHDRLPALNRSSPNYKDTEAKIAKINEEIETKKAQLLPEIRAELRQAVMARKRDEFKSVEASLKNKEQTRELLLSKINAERGEQVDH
ncbi:MAG: hypothetical protein JSS02_19590, partial [Planctomycetes bacterium]|nr:hypothetical protein [Planctomycetota bacterium]